MSTAAKSASGTIYDIGYRHYDGPRLGRQYAIQSLFVQGLGVVWGINRGARARLGPIVLSVLVILPALIQAALGGLSEGEATLVGYADYFMSMSVLYLLFCASQAPELVSSDQRSRTLILYLARALRRDDYVLARLFSLAVSVFLIIVTPLLIIFMGKVFTSTDVWASLRLEAPEIAPIFGAAMLSALVMAAISVAISSLTKRRAIATAGIVGFLLLMTALASILAEAVGPPASRWILLLNPFLAIGGVTHELFGAVHSPNSLLGRADLPSWAFFAACAGYLGLSATVLFTRYRSIDP